MDVKKIVCPCCGKAVDIPLHEYSRGFDFNYSILINSEKEFFDLVEMCPECGYAMLFKTGVSPEMKDLVCSQVYQNVRNNPNIEEGLKKWILVAWLSEVDENYTEAGIEYMKAFDYMELKEMDKDMRLIEKASTCFLNAAEEDTSFIDSFLAIDCIRRDGEFDMANNLLNMIIKTFTGELVEKLTWHEKLWIDIKTTEKRYLEI